MGPEEDVSKIGKKLEKMLATKNVDSDTALDLLNALKDTPMTLNALQKTRIGMTVNNFRKACSNDEVVALSKSLIKSWKKLLDSQTSNRSNDNEKKSSENNTPSKRDERKSSDPAKSKSGSSPKQSSFPSRNTDTNDSVRMKCREMISAALKVGDSPEGSQDADELAIAIEDCIYTEFVATDTKYKNRVRSRIANLKDIKNPELRNGVLVGMIAPERIAVMTAEEMASDELKKNRDKLTKEAINDHQLTMTGGTKSDLLKCGKCLKSNCSYNQVQTRSADEPMTTFVFCNECGNRWKFC